MSISSHRRKLEIFLAFAIVLVFLGGCALFEPSDCETDELPDVVLTLE